jgi:MFS family permease
MVCVATEQTPDRDGGTARDYGLAPGEERTRVFDAPEATRSMIPLPPPLPPRRTLTSAGGNPDARTELATRLPGLPPGDTLPLSRPTIQGPGVAANAADRSESSGAAPDSAAGPATGPASGATTGPATDLGPDDPTIEQPRQPGRPESDAARVLRQVGEGAEKTGRVFGRAGGFVGGRIRKVTGSGGARESGLSHLIELHAVNGAGDLLITLALAQSVFFGVQPGKARGSVALYLLITMVPFVLLAPVIGPLLDRFGHGRRIAMSLTMAARLVLALIMARTLHGSAALALYPAAFGCLAASKAYGVTRSAVIPRLLPPGTTLVKANSRTSMAGIVATFVFAPIGGLLVHFGAEYALFGAAVVFAFGAYLAIRLPKHVDSAEGEQKAQLKKRDRDLDPRLAETMPNLRLRSVGPAVVLALRANAAFRWFSGFLTIFIAFLVRYHPLDGYKPLVVLGMVATAAAVGNFIGTSLGAILKARAPEGVISTVLALTTFAVLAAGFYYSLATVLTVAAVAGMSQALAKLSLDALLQRDTLERVRTSAFARSETLLQLAWVVGGGTGIAVSFVNNGTFAFVLASVAMLSVCLITLKALSDLRFVAPNPAQQAGFSGA